jgi:uncharacterized protein (DUF362 family)
MDRRDFVRQVAAFSAGALATPIFDVSSILAAEEKPAGESVLSIAKGKDYGALVEQVLKPLGGMANFVKEGDRVVVKPNMAWDRTPEQAANAHPDVVKAVVRQCLDAGAKRVLVFDNTCNDKRRTYAKSGIMAAIESIDDSRARCVYTDDKKFVPVAITKGKSLKKFDFYKDCLPTECDCYIGGNRGEIHKDMGMRIAELNLVVYPKLTIIDATRILLRNGPTGGNLADVKVLDTLIASADTVAADAYATTLFDMKPDKISSTVAAAKLGLGEMDLSKVKIVKA